MEFKQDSFRIFRFRPAAVSEQDARAKAASGVRFPAIILQKFFAADADLLLFDSEISALSCSAMAVRESCDHNCHILPNTHKNLAVFWKSNSADILPGFSWNRKACQDRFCRTRHRTFETCSTHTHTRKKMAHVQHIVHNGTQTLQAFFFVSFESGPPTMCCQQHSEQKKEEQLLMKFSAQLCSGRSDSSPSR